MALVLIGLAILIILVLIAVKAGFSKEDANIDPGKERIIHRSGIYSVLRASPRGDLAALRPKEDEIRAYLAGVGEDFNGVTLSGGARSALIEHWKMQTEVNLQTIENGDKKGVSFYYYDFPNGACPVCASYIVKGNFVTREEIFNNPQIIPPLHIGCGCALRSHSGAENLRETTVAGMRPFFEGEAPPPLPEWTQVLSPEGRLPPAAGV